MNAEDASDSGCYVVGTELFDIHLIPPQYEDSNLVRVYLKSSNATGCFWTSKWKATDVVASPRAGIRVLTIPCSLGDVA